LSYFPSLIGVVPVHALKRLERIGPEILLIDDSVGTNDERLHSGHSILSRRSGEGESANHGAANHEVHLSHRRRRSLPLQDLEVVTVISLTSLRRITFRQTFGDFFSNRPFPSP